MTPQSSSRYRDRAEYDATAWPTDPLEKLDQLHLQAREQRIEEIKRVAKSLEDYPDGTIRDLMHEIAKI